MAAEIHILPVVRVERVAAPRNPAAPDCLTNVVRMRDYRPLYADLMATFRPRAVQWLSLLPPLEAL